MLVKSFIQYKDIKRQPLGSLIILNENILNKISSFIENGPKEKMFRYMGTSYISNNTYIILFDEVHNLYYEYEYILPHEAINEDYLEANETIEDAFKKEFPEMFEECVILEEPLKEHLEKTLYAASMIILLYINELDITHLKENVIYKQMKIVIKEIKKLQNILEFNVKKDNIENNNVK